MDAIKLLHTRHSASKPGDPAPSPESVRALLESAAHVPDHGRLLPWRVIVVAGEARARLGDVMAEALSRRNPLANEQSLAREREKALRAPLIIVVATRCDKTAKIPVIEQVLSAGYAAHSIMLAAFALGFGAMWKTGDAAYDDAVKSALAVAPDDLIVGFIHVGTDTGAPKTRLPRSPDEFVRQWTGSVELNAVTSEGTSP